jgi:DNA-binding NarL/FixJ family response regulator
VIRVALVEDQALVRAGLRSVVDACPGIRVVAEASDGEEALRLLPAAQADVALIDVRMPGRSGIDVLTELGARAPPSILLASFPDDEAASAGLRAGARGFLLKDVTPAELASAIEEVARGGMAVSPALTARVHQRARALGVHVPSSDFPEPLTDRERHVLRLVAAGWNNREIARACCIREGTAKNHVSAVLAKLGVRDRTRAVLRALELGLL